jgi:hypothetical protein
VDASFVADGLVDAAEEGEVVNGVEVGGDGGEGILHWNFLVFLGLRMNSLVCERKQKCWNREKKSEFCTLYADFQSVSIHVSL